MNNKHFIWIENSAEQKCRRSVFDSSVPENFGVYSFKKKYQFNKPIENLNIDIFADTKYFLYINDKFIGIGPVCPGGDYGNALSMPIQYYDNYEIEVNSDYADILVLVQLDEAVQADMSLGNGGLVISGTANLSDNTKEEIYTDESWNVCRDMRFPSINNYDYTQNMPKWQNAVTVKNIWNLKKSQIPLLKSSAVKTDFSPVSIPAGKEKDIFIETEKIYSAYLGLSVIASGNFEIDAYLGEIPEKNLQTQKITGNSSITHHSLVMSSISVCKLHIKNLSDMPLTLSDVTITYTRYPEDGDNGSFSCSDNDLNDIYNLGIHTLKICRQSIHLDSPAHQENMGCSGDYFIESLIEYYAFSDTRLTRFDIIRIADYLKMSKGYMFHTTYSLIWIEMLYEYYMHTADIEILDYAFDGVMCVLDKMKEGCDETHIIQNPVSYMFIDWTWNGDYNRHHPPKAMGQAPLNAFYYNALILASELSGYLNKTELKEKISEEAAYVKKSFNDLFYDKEKGLYFDGLDDETKNVSDFMPANIKGRYFSKYTNTLAALYGLCNDGKDAEILEKALYKSDFSDVQPYFMHFILEAIYKCGLFAKYGLSEIRRWTELVKECNKGMKEAWITYGGYGFDYSHAWGATPSYQLPSKLCGMKILEPGMRKLKFSPDLFGLQSADITIPSPYGIITVALRQDSKPIIKAPSEIEIAVK